MCYLYLFCLFIQKRIKRLQPIPPERSELLQHGVRLPERSGVSLTGDFPALLELSNQLGFFENFEMLRYPGQRLAVRLSEL
jgi:hypothetical protein